MANKKNFMVTIKVDARERWIYKGSSQKAAMDAMTAAATVLDLTNGEATLELVAEGCEIDSIIWVVRGSNVTALFGSPLGEQYKMTGDITSATTDMDFIIGTTDLEAN